ncbi:hypothetical protein [Inquilinus sp. OTU3971]|uniref:hypothetical protein n=1 Tax=Inquilinus sp. OTU3971 TaxID=3043855 RepID=UPI00313A7EEC
MDFHAALEKYRVAEAAERRAIEDERPIDAYDLDRATLDNAHAELLRAPITSVQDASTLFDLLWTHHTPGDTDDALNTVGSTQLIDRVGVVLRELAAKGAEAGDAHL